MRVLSIEVKEARNCTHSGRHRVEVCIGNKLIPQSTPWEQTSSDRSCFFNRKADFEIPSDINEFAALCKQYIKITLVYKRTLRMDKRAASTHIPFAEFASADSFLSSGEAKCTFFGCKDLYHKERYAGQLTLRVIAQEMDNNFRLNKVHVRDTIQNNNSGYNIRNQPPPQRQVAAGSSFSEHLRRRDQRGGGEGRCETGRNAARLNSAGGVAPSDYVY